MHLLKWFYMGSFGMLFFFHLFIYLGRRNKVSYLIYAFYCLSLININITAPFYFTYSYHYIYTLYFPLSVHITTGLFVLFVYYSLGINKTKIASISFCYYIFTTIVYFIFVLCSFIIDDLDIIKYFFIFIFISTFLCLISVLKDIIFNKKRKMEKSIFIILGICSFIICLNIYFIILVFKNVFPDFIVSFFFIINSLFFALALSKGFNQEYRGLIELKDSLEIKVKERTEQLKDSHDKKINFFMNLIYETKTPLTLVLNYLEMDINKRGLSNEINYVKQNADKLKKDMINFLDMEKLKRGQALYNNNRVSNFSKILKGIIVQFTDIAHNRNIDIICEIEENIFVKIDPVALDRIINNLIENALKYTGENGKINAVLTKTFEKILLRISDTGIGISKNQINNIFKPYHQISHKKRNIQGIGMGLNIVKKIMDDINGEIKVESKENEGSTFILCFQKADFDKEDVLTLKSDEQNPKDDKCMINLVVNKNKYKTKNILLVEDNIEMLNYLYDVLSKYYNVYTAENGYDALDKLVNIPKPNLIISDIMMDVMDGYDFYDELQEMVKYQDIPFIFLTAKTSEKDKISGLKKGAIDYIYKPFLNEELVNKIYAVLNLQEKQKRANTKEIGIKFTDIISKQSGVNNEQIFFDKECYRHGINKEEKEIIKLLIEGYEYKGVSRETGKSLNYIRHQVNKIYKKCEVKNKIDLTKLFINKVNNSSFDNN